MIFFTDGGCIGNGTSKAVASYAVYFNNTVIRGHVMPYEYKDDLTTSNVNAKPSNNRGELLAIIHAFIQILKMDDQNNFIVYSDSQICVKTINEWYESRLRKGTTNSFKNIDLIEIMMKLYNQIKLLGKKIEVVHVRSHMKITDKMSEKEKMIVNGNNIVDKYASEILKNKKLIDYEIINI